MRSSWVGLAILVVMTSAARCDDCRRDRARPARPVVEDDGSTFVTAWRTGNTVYVQREGYPARAVYSHRDHVGQPTLHPQFSTTIVGVTQPYPIARPSRNVHVFVEVDAEGVPVDEPHHGAHFMSVDERCVTRGGAMPPVFTAYKTITYSKETLLWVHRYEAHALRSYQMFRADDASLECAIATGDEHIVVALRYPNRIDIRILASDDVRTAIARLEIPAADNQSPWELSVVHAGDDTWAALVRHPGGELHVVRFDGYSVRESAPLPRELDAATADLGSSEHGLFVTWINGNTLHVHGVDSGRHITRRVPSRASLRAHAGRHEDAAVAVRAGNRVTLERFPAFP